MSTHAMSMRKSIEDPLCCTIGIYIYIYIYIFSSYTRYILTTLVRAVITFIRTNELLQLQSNEGGTLLKIGFQNHCTSRP